MTFNAILFHSLSYMSFIVPHLALIINAGINLTFVSFYLTIIQAYRGSHIKIALKNQSLSLKADQKREKITNSGASSVLKPNHRLTVQRQLKLSDL